jgi:hypothetical protein
MEDPACPAHLAGASVIDRLAKKSMSVSLLAIFTVVLLGIIYTSVYKVSKHGKQLPNKAICDGQIANPSVPRMDIAESIRYTYRESTHGFRDNTAC